MVSGFPICLVVGTISVILICRFNFVNSTNSSLISTTSSPLVGVTSNGTGVGELRRSGRFQCQEAQEDIDRVQRQGELRCRCPTIYAPVCGSDGNTYHNRCFLNCTGTIKYERFTAAPLTLESWGPCPHQD